MDSLQAAQREVRIHLRCRDIGVPQNHLHAAQVCAVLNHVGGTTVAQPVWAGRFVRQLDEMPNLLARKRRTVQR